MRYTVSHVTRFSYDTPITESVMEARMQPRSDGLQRCLHFALTAEPTARVMMYRITTATPCITSTSLHAMRG